MTANDEQISKFRLYIASILHNEDSKNKLRYLSKNNNNILRLSSIKEAFPNALIIIPFRDPLQQADSLANIHKLFIELQRTNKFIIKYMQWLVHHEFGHDHRRFHFEERESKYNNTLDINYWLELWLDTYSWLKINSPSNAIFLSYELLCTDTNSVWSKLAELACIPNKLYESDIITLKNRQVHGDIDKSLLNESNNLHAQLVEKHNSRFGSI